MVLIRLIPTDITNTLGLILLVSFWSQGRQISSLTVAWVNPVPVQWPKHNLILATAPEGRLVVAGS
jgi:hypothetical protein